MTVTADIDVAVDFLNWYLPGGFWVLTSIDPAGGPTLTASFQADEETRLRRWLDNEVERGRNIYFHVNRTLRRIDSKASKTDMKSVDWLHVDVDPDPGEDLRSEQQRILGIMEKHADLPRPSLIVFSGGGYQAFWRLAEPIPIDGDDAKAEDAKRYNIQIETLFGADSCHDVCRIMRLPGTINFPNKKKIKRGQKPALAAVIKRTDDVYDISKFTKAPMVQDGLSLDSNNGAPDVELSGNRPYLNDVDELGDAVDGRVKTVIVNGWDQDQPLTTKDQSRSAWLFYVVCSLVRAEIDDDTIYAVITDPDFKISESVYFDSNGKKKSAAAVERYAIKQIRSAKEWAIEPMLQKLNGSYAYVEDVGGRSRIVKETYNPGRKQHQTRFLLRDDFKATYCNQTVEIMVTGPKGVMVPKDVEAGGWWLKHAQRRSYEGVLFAPNEDHPGYLNLWRGFACEAIPGDCSLYLDHLLKVLCRGNKQNYDYLIKWMAFAVQFPGVVPTVAVVLRGSQGAGKGTFVEFFGNLFGCHYWHVTNPKHVVGQFNGSLETAVVTFADEAFVAGSKEHESNLKTLISENTVNVEKKGIDVYETRNCCHLIMASNDTWVVPVDIGDRRFFILDVSDDVRCDTEYFAAMRNQMEKEGGSEALLHHLMNLDLTDFDVRTRPVTDELRRQQLHSMGPDYVWWLQRLEDGRLLPHDGSWTGEAINDAMASYYAALFPGKSEHAMTIKLGRFLKDVCPAGWPISRQKSSRFKILDAHGRELLRDRPKYREFPSLQVCRDHWDEKFGPHDWEEIPSDPEPEEQVAHDEPF